ncbi:MAG TPA: peptidylprolyl isomerase [Chloroflexota bacterium]|nr:peptidylprolyl isomerase [Chloroflexota bacterium]
MTAISVRGRARAATALLALVCPLLLAACGQGSAGSAPTATAATSATPSPLATLHIFPTGTPVPTYAVPRGTPIPATALAARVNGQAIPLRQYEQQRDAYVHYLWEQQHIDPQSAAGKRLLAQQGPRILESLIGSAMLLRYAQQHRLTATKVEIQQQIQQDGGPAVVARKLAAAYATMQDYMDQITLTRAELSVMNSRTYTATELHVRQILVKTPAVAASVYKQLQAHGDFATLAQHYSQDLTTRNNGGDLGFLTQPALGPILGKAALALPLHTYSHPIRSSLGYHIIEVLGKLPNVPLTGRSLNIAKLAYWEQWYAAQRKAASVEIFIHPS